MIDQRLAWTPRTSLIYANLSAQCSRRHERSSMRLWSRRDFYRFQQPTPLQSSGRCGGGRAATAVGKAVSRRKRT